MDKTKNTKMTSIKVNFVMNTMLTMSAFIFPLITFPYVSRILQAEGTGKVQFATSLITYFVLISQLGIPTYGVRACAAVRENRKLLSRTVQELLIIQSVTTVVSYLIFGLMLLLVPRLQQERSLYMIMSANILFSFIGMEWLYKGLEQYTYIAARSIAFKFLAVILMLLLIHQKSDYYIYGALTIFAASASNIFNLINVHRYVSLKPTGGYQLAKHIKPVFVFFAMSCATTIYTNLDSVMLGFISGDTEVGYYGAAVKIKTILVSIVTSLGTVLLPRASFYVQKGMMEDFRRITAKAIHFVFLLASPLMAYFMLYAENGIHFLSGSGYEGAITPMIVIMPTLLIIGLTNILGIQILVPTGREIVVLYSEIVGAVVDIIINFLLIPTMQSTGAAIGTLIAEFAVFVVQAAVLHKELKHAVKKIPFVTLIMGLAAAIAASFWVPALNLSNFMTMAVSAILFFAAYGAVLLVRREPFLRQLLAQLLEKIK